MIITKNIYYFFYYKTIILNILNNLIKNFKFFFNAFKKMYKKNILIKNLINLDQQKNRGEFIINNYIL